MWRVLKNRIKQGYRTSRYPKEAPVFPPRFRGKPTIDFHQLQKLSPSLPSPQDPTGALNISPQPAVDLGKLLFNEDLKEVASPSVLGYSQDHRMAVSHREDLVLKDNELKLASGLKEKMKKVLGRSLKLREVCAGSCGGCDLEIQALDNVVFDLSRFGIQFVASPRHADGLIVTGMVTKNMESALQAAYEATPFPKIVIAVGACAISGGIFCGSPQVHSGVDRLLPVDLYIPGCPPHPLTILDGLLRLLDKIDTPDKKKS